MCKWFAWESDGAVVILPTLTCDSVNVDHGDPDDRTMITGLYTVRDISCSKCKTVVGWTYVGFFYNPDIAMLRRMISINALYQIDRLRRLKIAKNIKKTNSY
jgi:hypothetical protein